MLTFLYELDKFDNCKKPKRLGMYRCHCGKEVEVPIHKVKAGKRKSCGCTKEPEKDLYKSTRNSWIAMTHRCYNPKIAQYNDYGGRGITVCDRWRGKNGFDNFVLDMGIKPAIGYSIKRKDNDGNYCPENCIWVSRKTQCQPKERGACIWIVSVEVPPGHRKKSKPCGQPTRGKQYDLCEEHWRLFMELKLITLH